MRGVVVVDMISEFVDGRLGSDKARAIVPKVAEIVNRAHAAGIPVAFVNDGHQEGDPESEVWGPHALVGSDESGLSSDLLVLLDEGVIEAAANIRKTEYDAFGTYSGGEQWARSKSLSEVVIVGTCTHICIAQTAIGAMQRGFKPIVVADAVAGFPDTDEAFWLRHIRTVTGADVPFLADLQLEEVAV